MRAVSIIEKAGTPEDPVFFTQGNTLLDETEKGGVFFAERPIKPGRFIILTPDIIITFLRKAKLITSGEHRYALGEQQGDGHAFHPADPQLVDGG